MREWFLEHIVPSVDILVLIYSFALVVSYILMALLAIYALWRYKRKNYSTDYNTILYSESLEPSISVIASSYNESLMIVECVRSLLALRYNNYEVIVVNDGSTDDSFQKACKEFSMIKVDYYINEHIPTKPVRGIYRSADKAYPNLVFIDKENGGKADAMNAGINVSTKLYTLCVDVDSVLDVNSLLKLAKPIAESTDKEVVSVGGAVYVANGCLFKNGVLLEKGVSKSNQVKMQVVEYMRAFLIGRMGWGQINGLMLVSGALGVFRKDYLLAINGYRASSIGEDMEMLMRMRQYLYDNKIPHKVEYIPEPLLWTEVPPTLEILGRQRTRWSRGLIDSLLIHKKLMFNPRYGVLGIVSYPYFFFFEWLAPFIEALGLIYVAILVSFGLIHWKIYLVLSVFMYLFGLIFSFLGIFFGEMTYHVYEKKTDLLKLFLASFTEAFVYHPLIVFWALKGNYMYLTKQNKWGEMPRQGLGAKKK
ncbi:MAG: glycosyltransferase [Muribaculaceae bacterium]